MEVGEAENVLDDGEDGFDGAFSQLVFCLGRVDLQLDQLELQLEELETSAAEDASQGEADDGDTTGARLHPPQAQAGAAAGRPAARAGRCCPPSRPAPAVVARRW